jgi:hypothetical protein
MEVPRSPTVAWELSGSMDELISAARYATAIVGFIDSEADR